MDNKIFGALHNPTNSVVKIQYLS